MDYLYYGYCLIKKKELDNNIENNKKNTNTNINFSNGINNGINNVVIDKVESIKNIKNNT